jgi:hypothetical protein
MITADTVERMTAAERVQAMELLWDSLATTRDAADSPAWHGRILAGRLAQVESGDADFLTLDELKQRLGRA